MLLAIDTSTRVLGVALHSGDAVIAEQMISIGTRHSELLAMIVHQMLDMTRVKIEQVTAVGVAKGPGSYTGLRIGIAFAKGFAAYRELPLIGVGTLEIVAVGQPFANTRNQLIVVAEAGRNRILAQQFRGRKGRWVAEQPYQNTTWEELLPTIDQPTYITGEVSSEGGASIQTALRQDAPITIIRPSVRARRSSYLAEEAWQQLQLRKRDEFHPSKLVPVYAATPPKSS